jgi:GcrA cell cycle regulator
MAYSWNAQSDEELARLWAAGHTTMQIAAAFGVTKNSIIGRAHRIGLPARPGPINRPNGYQAPPRTARNPKITLPLIAVAPSPVVPQKRAGRVQRSAVSASAKCQFPLWKHKTEPTHRYCNAPAALGSSWCNACREVVFTGRTAAQFVLVRKVAK